MRNSLITRFAALLIVSIVLTGCKAHSGTQGGESSSTQKAGPFTIEFRPQPDPPRVGLDSGFVLSISDASGPVTGASVSLQLVCTSFHQQGPLALATESTGWPGRYEAQGVTTGVAGNWTAEVTVRDARRGTVTATFPFSVRN